jgi:hypothetical protein
VTRGLIIVSREESARYTFLHGLLDETMDVIFDRRTGERRRHEDPAPVERRRGDRRLPSVAEELEAVGWAVVTPEAVVTVEAKS